MRYFTKSPLSSVSTIKTHFIRLKPIPIELFIPKAKANKRFAQIESD